MYTTYRHNTTSVSHQTIDDEVIVIHFETGHYFSLKGTAAELWHALEAPADAASLARMFRDADDAVCAAVDAFLDELAGDGLVERVAQAPAAREPDGGRTFELPVIERHTDLEAILMADPIHEVEDEGWPSTRPA